MHLSPNVSIVAQRAQNKLDSATHKPTRHSHPLLLMILYTGTGTTTGRNNDQSGRLRLQSNPAQLQRQQSLLMSLRMLCCSTAAACASLPLWGQPKLGVGLSQGLDVPQQRIVVLHLHSRFLQVLGYLLSNLQNLHHWI